MENCERCYIAYYIDTPEIWEFTGRIKYNRIYDFDGNFKFCKIYFEITYLVDRDRFNHSTWKDRIEEFKYRGLVGFLFPRVPVTEWINADDILLNNIEETTIVDC